MIAVAIGGAAGSVARYGVASIVQRQAPTIFPLATFLVNVAGAFVLGVLVGRLTGNAPGIEAARLLLATGFCGGFTTFSAFSYETIVLARDSRMAVGVLYVAATLVLCIGAAAVGVSIAR